MWLLIRQKALWTSSSRPPPPSQRETSHQSRPDSPICNWIHINQKINITSELPKSTSRQNVGEVTISILQKTSFYFFFPTRWCLFLLWPLTSAPHQKGTISVSINFQLTTMNSKRETPQWTLLLLLQNRWQATFSPK